MRYLSTLLLILLVSTVVLAAGKPVATVNGKVIDEATFEHFMRQHAKQVRRAPTPQDQQAVLTELINRELLYQRAIKLGLEKDPELQFRIEQKRREMIIGALMRKTVEATPITDDMLKKEYDAQVAGMNAKEYKARHILLKTEAEAQAVIAELAKGKDFAKLAKKKSVGPSAEGGGDLGWFRLDQMVPAFAQAVLTAKKGQVVPKPVQTQFGWHVIKLEDTRPMPVPKFEDVKPQILNIVRQQRIQNLIETLAKEAKIEVSP
ncbi:MAG TPA: peptidylprolyl isomerase [Gammaproteobacteria bacterium]|nr:peptidylprolyl isomerase [Gammaproteobacteria bacterium]